MQNRNNNTAIQADDEIGPLIRTESESNDSAMCPHQTNHAQQHQRWEEDEENESSISLMDNAFEHQRQKQQHYKEGESESNENDDDCGDDESRPADIVVNIA